MTRLKTKPAAGRRSGLSEVKQLVSPDIDTSNSTHDAAGNLLTRTDNRGVLSTYSYNALNRLVSTIWRA